MNHSIGPRSVLSWQQASWGHMYLFRDMTQIYSSCSKSHIPPNKGLLSDIPHRLFFQSSLGSVSRLITEAPKASPRAHSHPTQQLQWKVIVPNSFVVLGNCVDFAPNTCFVCVDTVRTSVVTIPRI